MSNIISINFFRSANTSREIEKKSLFFSYTSKNHFNTSIWNYYPLFHDHFTSEPNMFANYSLFMWRHSSLAEFMKAWKCKLWLEGEEPHHQWTAEITSDNREMHSRTNDEWRRQTQYKVRIPNSTRHLSHSDFESLCFFLSFLQTTRNATQRRSPRWKYVNVFAVALAIAWWRSIKKVNRFPRPRDLMLCILNHSANELHVWMLAGN